MEAQDEQDAIVVDRCAAGDDCMQLDTSSMSTGMLVEGSLPGAASGIIWIAYTERKNAGSATSAAQYRCNGGSLVDLTQEKLCNQALIVWPQLLQLCF